MTSKVARAWAVRWMHRRKYSSLRISSDAGMVARAVHDAIRPRQERYAQLIEDTQLFFGPDCKEPEDYVEATIKQIAAAVREWEK